MKLPEIKIVKDRLLESPAGRPFALDLYAPLEVASCPLVIFAHGFKGFKDWGHWRLIAGAFARRGFAFLKFNFSHNGVTPEHPSDFVDLEAFGQNNFTKELQDLEALVTTLCDNPGWLPANIDLDRIALIGHSRGGALAILYAATEPRIKALITWSSVMDVGFLWKDAPWLEQWKEKGVIYVPNARTGQDMPLYYQLFEDYRKNGDRYYVEAQLQHFRKPMLIVHGSADTGVPLSHARQLKSWYPGADLVIIDGADHVYGGAHPFEGEELHPYSVELVEATAGFLQNHL